MRLAAPPATERRMGVLFVLLALLIAEAVHDLQPVQMQPTNDDEERLTIDMFRGYNNLVRPFPCNNSTITFVEFGISLVLLIGIDEKNQIMQSSIWATLKWDDCQFGWSPNDYGGLESIRVPSDRVWLPDIVLFNNADGNYEVSFKSNVVVDYRGKVSWVPPAIFKSSCRMEVTYFPFDEQTCHLIFGSWTYDKKSVQLRFYSNKKAVELEDYSSSAIWDILDVPGIISPDKSKMKFEIVLRRKSLFYTIILLIPTVLMAHLSLAVFFLPAECSEKITLGISLLLALVVFLLLVSKILPPTSATVPLIAKYLLLVFSLNVVTIFVTVIIINVYYRSPSTHRMPRLVRQIFLKLLPRLLMMQRPERIPIFNGCMVEEYSVEEIFDASLIMPSITATILPFSEVGRRRHQPQYPSRHHKNCAKLKQTTKRKRSWSLSRRSTDSGGGARGSTDLGGFGFPVDETADHTRYRKATDSLLSGNDKKVRDDWKFISMVMDRLLLLIFFGITAGGTISIIFSAPHVFDYVDQSSAWCSDAEQRLMIDLFAGYNSLVPPGGQRLEWAVGGVADDALERPSRCDGIPANTRESGTVRLPPDKVWLPDIVLFNNADGNYEVSFYSNVVVEANGDMLWVPPAIYKSSCTISVDYFPFDEQVCSMIFGSWTFSPQEVVINYLSGKRQVELNDYSESGIWDLIEAPGQLIQKKSKIAYRIRMRRKPLFFTVILIVPTILMAILSITVFYLPAEADEKITLSISILLALVVFLLLVSKILPPVTVIIINVYFRSPTTHRMPRWIKVLFLYYLPLFLLMRRNEPYTKRPKKKQKTKAAERNGELNVRYPINEFIPMHREHIKNEWKFISMVLDRLLLYVFFGITLGGTLGILLSAPNVFESTNQTQIIQQLMKAESAEINT
ncbi:hypothetical protein M3Y99_00788800 [Aphelenchoides fujianensis]|nr:hypothetical protein M3Y99_00788800 [Aphelenchoides fujianensis]